MSTLEQIFNSHPLEASYRIAKRATCIEAFSDWVTDTTFNDWHLSLFSLSNNPPLCFYSHNTVTEALSFFRQYPTLTWRALSRLSHHLNHAITSLLRPTASWKEQDTLSLDSPDKAAEFDSIWHPEYQRYSEHAFNHLIQVPLYVLGQLRKRDYNSPSLANRAQYLASSIAPSLTMGFDPIVRNAIAHGTTEFELMSVRYIDKKNTRLLASFEFAELFDNLIDTCHGLLASIILFIAEARSQPDALAVEELPFGIRYLLTVGLVSHPSLSIVTMLETRSPGTGFQLNVVCKAQDPSRNAHQFEGLFIAWISAKLFPTYDRYLISIDSGRPTHSTLSINGRALAEAIAENQDLAECAAHLVQGSLLWYDAPNWRSWLSTFRGIFRTRMPELLAQIRRQIEEAGLVKPIYRYRVSDVQNNSSPSMPRLTCYAILRDRGSLTDSKLLATLAHLIRRLRRHRIRRSDLYGPKGLPQNPMHITIRLASRPIRIRTLKSQGWANPNLVLIAEWSKDPRSAAPFYTREVDYASGPLRVKYNPNLISPKSSA